MLAFASEVVDGELLGFQSETAFLQDAMRAYESAIGHFGRLAVPPLVDVAAMWNGYVLRNLAQVLADMGEPTLAVNSYRRALKERELFISG
jgi:hypothetical protein